MKSILQYLSGKPFLTVSCTSILLTASVILVSYPSQSDFTIIAPLYILAFACYAIVLSNPRPSSLSLIIIGALIARCVLIFVFPNLSDDIYRFLWDGKLISHGLNPYTYYPPDVLAMNLQGLDASLYDQMNSPNYYTVYPPVSQMLYFIGGLADSWELGAVLIKALLFLAEIINIILIIKLLDIIDLPRKNVLIYALNPLIIVELSGNMHFESLMICFVLLSLYLISTSRYKWSSLACALGVATKLLPLFFFPYLWKLSRSKKNYFWIFCISGFLIFLPVILGVQITHFLSSIDLYFGKFEFNASIYYLLRYIGYILSGYNLIRYLGPLLGLITLFIAYRQFLKPHRNIQDIIQSGFVVFCCYLFLGTTIHPWYLSIPIVLTCFLPYRFVLVWSFFICMTYINYSYSTYSENLIIVALEYIVVFSILIYEILGFRQKSSYT